jgi:hypothetical protein
VIKKIVDAEVFPDYAMPNKTTGRKKKARRKRTNKASSHELCFFRSPLGNDTIFNPYSSENLQATRLSLHLRLRAVSSVVERLVYTERLTNTPIFSHVISRDFHR